VGVRFRTVGSLSAFKLLVEIPSSCHVPPSNPSGETHALHLTEYVAQSFGKRLHNRITILHSILTLFVFFCFFNVLNIP
jgi:hypothetical protein